MATIVETLNSAIEHHTAGRYEAAERLYRSILDAAPLFADAWNLCGMLYTQIGRPLEGVDFLAHGLECRPNWPEAHFNLGNAWRSLSKWEAAIFNFRRAIELNPQYVEAFVNLGNTLLDQKRFEEAMECYRSAIQLRPQLALAHSNLGNALSELRRDAEALDCYRRSIELDPQYVEAYNNLGRLLRSLARLPESVDFCRRAIALNPRFSEAYNNLANALQDLGQIDEAVTCYRKALELDPHSAAGHNNLGVVLAAQGNITEAVAAFRHVAEIDPQYAEAHFNLGNTLQRVGHSGEAAECFRRAATLKPDLAPIHNNLGIALGSQGRYNEAIANCRRALELDPQYVDAHYNLGNNLLKLGLPAEAISAFSQAIKLRPDYAEAYNNRGSAWKDQGELSAARADFERAVELRPDYAAAYSNLLYTLHYESTVSCAELIEKHADFDYRFAAPLRTCIAPFNKRKRVRRLKVGFVSPDFGKHPVGYFFVRLIENLNQHKFDATCYATRCFNDDLAKRIAGAARWQDVSRLSDSQLAEQIRDDEIDVLFDLTGHSGDNRLLVFARKPAPVQATWIGYEGTTGLSTIDFILADRFVAPEGSESDFTEQVLRLPEGYLCFDPPSQAPPVAPPPKLKNRFTTFGSFNNLAKITPEVVMTWSKILQAVPQSRLIIKYRGLADLAVKDKYNRMFAENGVDLSRVELLPFGSYADYLASYSRIDVALDPFPFSGSTVTCEALWMGVPVITCSGRTFASRHSLSHLSNIGFTETVASNLDDYVRLAEQWGSDAVRLAERRMTLRDQMARSPLCDGPRFARNWEMAVQEAWGRSVESSG